MAHLGWLRLRKAKVQRKDIQGAGPPIRVPHSKYKSCPILMVVTLIALIWIPFSRETGKPQTERPVHRERAHPIVDVEANNREVLPATHKLCKAVDLVYTFVDGSTEKHKSLQRMYIDPKHFANNGIENRFRDFGEASTLLFSLRSARKYAPWVRRTYIVVSDKEDQTPSFLEEFQNVHVVEHSQIFVPGPGESWRPQEVLPNFNSCVIELQVHKIPGLAECYLYLNDDVLFTKPMQLSDFLQEERPYSFSNYQVVPRSPKGQDDWGKKLLKVGRMFHARTKMPRKDLHLVGHHGHFFIKSIVAQVVELFAREVSETVTSRYRTSRSLWLPFVYNNFLVWKLGAERKRVHALYYVGSTLTTVAALSDLYVKSLENTKGVEGVRVAFKKLLDSSGKYSWLCLNDNLQEEAANYSKILHAMKTSLLELYPAMSRHSSTLKT